jgi:uncharacterized protein YcbX
VTSHPPGRVGALFRYPVKSLVGEELAEVHVDRRGIRGDRLWAVRDPDGKLGSGKSSSRFRRMDGLLALSATYDGDLPVLSFPDGRSVRADDPAMHEALSAHVGRPVRLEPEEQVSHFDDGPLHLVSTGAVAAVSAAHGHPVDVRRLRPSVVVDSAALEDEWTGRVLAVGGAVVRVLAPMPRCVMLDLAQPAAPVGLRSDRGLLRTVTAVRGGDLGVVADVVEPGPVRKGDEVRVVG